MVNTYGNILNLLNNFTTTDQNWQRGGQPSKIVKQKSVGMTDISVLILMRVNMEKIANRVHKLTMAHALSMQHVQQISTYRKICENGHTSDQYPLKP